MLAACGAAAAALVLRGSAARASWRWPPRWSIAPVLVAGDVWDEPRVVDFRTSAAQVGVAVRSPPRDRRRAHLGVPPLPARRCRSPPIAVLPLRVPLEIGGETANLLVPAVRGDRSRRDRLGARAPAPGPTRAARRATRGRSGCAGCSPRPWSSTRSRRATRSTSRTRSRTSASSSSRSRSSSACSPRSSGPGQLLRRTLIAVGAGDRRLRGWSGSPSTSPGELFFNPELGDANELHVYFRVNSIFFDPNIFGRYLALALTAFAACDRLGRRPPRARGRRGVSSRSGWWRSRSATR